MHQIYPSAVSWDKLFCMSACTYILRPGSVPLILPSHKPQATAHSFFQHCNQVLADLASPRSADCFAAAGAAAEHASVEEDAAL